MKKRNNKKSVLRSLIDDFLDAFCTESKDNEGSDFAELMMDNHKCIEYEGVTYYVPENSILYTEDDELLKELLVNTYLL